MLLAQKSFTDKSEPENDLFCHTVRGSDSRFYLVIFIDKYESHFKIAWHPHAPTASEANAQISFSWGSSILKMRKPKGRAVLLV